MPYRCYQCNQLTEMPVALNEAQLRVQVCATCGGVGTLEAKGDSSERWWIGVRGERHGPYTIEQLIALLGDGRITANSYVWGPGFEAWARAGQVPQLSPGFAARAAPPPLPPPLPPVTRSPARPATRAGMFSGHSAADGDSQAMPLPSQDSVIAPLASVTSPVVAASPPLPAIAAPATPPIAKPATPPIAAPATPPVAAPATPPIAAAAKASQPRLDDVRRPPPTVFGMPAVAPAPVVVPPAPAVQESPATARSPAPAEQVLPPVASAPAVPVVAREGAVAKTPTVAVPEPAGVKEPTSSRAAKRKASTRASADLPRAPAVLETAAPEVTVSARSDAPEARTTTPNTPVAEAKASSPSALAAAAAQSTEAPASARTVGVHTHGLKPMGSKAAEGTSPSAARVPDSLATSRDIALDDDFFAATGSAASGDIFAAMDSSAAQSAPGGIDLNAMMADTRAGGRIPQLTKTEMHALREEFSVVARLEKHNRKRWILAAAVLVFIVGVVLAVVNLTPSRELEYGGKGTSVSGEAEGAVQRYEVPVVLTQPEEEALLSPETEVAKVAADADPKSKGAKTSTSSAARVTVKTAPPPDKNEAAGPSVLTAERFAELTRDEVGKSELKLNFDADAAARLASEQAAEKRATQADDIAEKVSDAFKKKASQFSRCSDAKQEKLKIYFTVTITGKVVNSSVEGTESGAKRSCIVEILGRSLFPAANEPRVYGNTLFL